MPQLSLRGWTRYFCFSDSLLAWKKPYTSGVDTTLPNLQRKPPQQQVGLFFAHPPVVVFKDAVKDKAYRSQTLKLSTDGYPIRMNHRNLKEWSARSRQQAAFRQRVDKCVIVNQHLGPRQQIDHKKTRKTSLLPRSSDEQATVGSGSTRKGQGVRADSRINVLQAGASCVRWQTSSAYWIGPGAAQWFVK